MPANDTLHALLNLTDATAVVAVHAPHIVEQIDRLPDEDVQRVWNASRWMLQGWTGELHRYVQRGQSPTDTPILSQGRLLDVLSQVFLHEMPARIWTSIAVAVDERHGERQLTPLAENIMGQQAEARRWGLAALIAATDVPQLGDLDRLRRRIERLTDLLLATFVRSPQLANCSCDLERADDFRNRFLLQSQTHSHEHVCDLILSAVRASLRRPIMHLYRSCEDAELTDDKQVDWLHQLAAGVLAWIPDDATLSDGTFKPLLQLRAERSRWISDRMPMGEQFSPQPTKAEPLAWTHQTRF